MGSKGRRRRVVLRRHDRQGVSWAWIVSHECETRPHLGDLMGGRGQLGFMSAPGNI
jgi:hypothetical protein